MQKTLEVLRLSRHLFAELIVVDNASTDGTSQMLGEKQLDLQVIRLASNVGIAGYNKGFERAKGEWVLALDDDSFPEPGCLEKFRVLASSWKPDVAVVACAVRNEGCLMTWNWPLEVCTFWGCGAFMRKSVLSEIGGYREDYFLYQNELEWTLRAKLHGYRATYIPELVVEHLAVPVNRPDNRAFRHNYRNQIHIACAYYKLGRRLDFLLRSFLVTFFKGLFKYSFADFIYIWSAFCKSWAWQAPHPGASRPGFQRWLALPAWKELEMLPPDFTDLPRRLFHRKPIY